MARKLTKLQARFVEEYMLDMNSTQAAGRAGSKAKDLTVAGAEFLANPNVKLEINKLSIERSERTRINADWVLSRLAEEAEADIADLYDEETGTIKPVHEWPKIWRQGLVAGLEITELTDPTNEGGKIGEVSKIKISDRVKRLELIGKHIRVNAFQDVVKHEGLEALADRLARAKKRKSDK